MPSIQFRCPWDLRAREDSYGRARQAQSNPQNQRNATGGHSLSFLTSTEELSCGGTLWLFASDKFITLYLSPTYRKRENGKDARGTSKEACIHRQLPGYSQGTVMEKGGMSSYFTK